MKIKVEDRERNACRIRSKLPFSVAKHRGSETREGEMSVILRFACPHRYMKLQSNHYVSIIVCIAITVTQTMVCMDSQPIPHLYSSTQANSAHVFRCGIGQIECAELVKRVTQMNDITKHAIGKKTTF